MKTSIKIALIAIVALGIIVTIVMTFSGTGGISDIRIPDPEGQFQIEIKKSVDSCIVNKPYEQATLGYDKVLEQITLEETANPDFSTKDKEYGMNAAFCAFAPIFCNFAKDYFNRSSWSENEISALSRRAQSLRSTNIADQPEITNVLDATIKNVSNYEAAVKVIHEADHCTSIDQVKKVRSEAESYMKAPLTNERSIASQLSAVETAAKNSYARIVASSCEHVISGYKGYGSYDKFLAAYNSAKSKINDYTNALGSNSQLSSLMQKLSKIDNDALDYYSEQEDQSGPTGRIVDEDW